jgi:hypothetical protein
MSVQVSVMYVLMGLLAGIGVSALYLLAAPKVRKLMHGVH